MKSNRIRRRVYELLSKAASLETSGPSPGQRELHFVFFRKPNKFVESDEKCGHVAGVQLEKTVLKGKLWPNYLFRYASSTFWLLLLLLVTSGYKVYFCLLYASLTEYVCILGV